MNTKIKNLILISFFVAYSSITESFAERKICIIGDALAGVTSSSGWDKGSASPLTNVINSSTTFCYKGYLNAGNFKFILENTDDSWLPTWNKTDDTHLYKRTSQSQGDNLFNISTAGNYAVTIDTAALTIKVETLTENIPINFNSVFMVGDATSIDWDITNSIELTKNPGNPFEFSYKGYLDAGEFKFPVNRNSSWTQNFFMKASNSQMVLQNSPDVKWTITEAGNYSIVLNTNTLSIDIRKLNTWNGIGNWSNAANWSSGTLPGTSEVIDINSGEVIIDDNVSLYQLNILPGAKLTVNSGKIATIQQLNIKSGNTGTGTFIDNGTSNITTANVQQYLTTGRNWYISSPVMTPSVSSLNKNTNSYIVSYDEPNGNSAPWKTEPDTLTRCKGYIAVSPAGGNDITLNFNGVINNGNRSIALTRTAGQTKEGFNLVGNPYPSYLNWSLVTADPLNANISTTMWFRTKTTGNLYTFSTYNSTGDISVANNATTTISKFIPPMQAFWVRVNNGTVSTNLTFKNTMRAHKDINGNTFKAPRLDNQQLLRLQVSNGTNTDEAVVYFNTNASKGFDSFDSQKMFNNNEDIPEIYTVVENEKLVINGMSELKSDTVIPLGFVAGKEKTYVLTVNEMKNFSESINIFLIDKLENTSTLLNEGGSYRFTADVTPASSNRFNLLFKVPAISTKVENNLNSIIYSYVNSANQITIISPEKSEYSIYNAVGQKIIGGFTTNNYFTVNSKLQTGMFVVKIGDNYSTRVIIK